MAGSEDALEEKMFSRVKEGISQHRNAGNETDLLVCPQKNGVGIQCDKNACKTGSLAHRSTLECVAI